MNTRSYRRLFVCAVMVLAPARFFAIPQNVSAQVYYTPVDLGRIDPNVRHYPTLAYAVNSSSQVVGRAAALDPNDGNRITAFFWQNGVMTDIGTMTGGNYAEARDINDAGEIAGFGYVSGFARLHALHWHDGTYTDLHPLLMQSGLFSSLGSPENLSSIALKINASGQILGNVSNTSNVDRWFIYQNGVVTLVTLPSEIIDPVPSCCRPTFVGFNNLGQIVGYFAVDGGSQARTFVWDNGTTTVLSQPQGWPTSNGTAINDSGQIAGRLYNGVANHPFLFSNGVMTDIDIGSLDGAALAINNSGTVLGSYGVFSGYSGQVETHPFLYSNGVVTDVNDLIAQTHEFNSQGPWYISQCSDISEQGHIVCTAQPRWYVNPKYDRAFLLVPTLDVEPPWFTSFGAGPESESCNMRDGIYQCFVAATSPEGAVVGLYGSALDVFDRNPSITFSHTSGSLFPIGGTTVTVTATDDSGNNVVTSFKVNVIDYPPALSLPEAIFTDATSASGAEVNYVASAHDVIDGDREIGCSPVSGSTFAIGETIVNCSAADSAGHANSGSFSVFVLGANQEGTPTGGDVPVVSSDSGLSLTFGYVNEPGVTTISPIDPGTIGTTPSGFAVSDVAYEIQTTATGAENGVTLAFAVPNSEGMSEAEFSALRVLHNENGQLVELSTWHDYGARTVYAFTYSFSPFYLARRINLNIETLYNRGTAYKAGSTIPIKLNVRDDVTNANLSSSNLVVTARSLKRLGGGSALTVNDSGAANPDNNFRYLGDTNGGSYIFNLSTKGLVPGEYALSFYVGSDRSFFHTVKFEVK